MDAPSIGRGGPHPKPKLPNEQFCLMGTTLDGVPNSIIDLRPAAGSLRLLAEHQRCAWRPTDPGCV